MDCIHSAVTELFVCLDQSIRHDGNQMECSHFTRMYFMVSPRRHVRGTPSISVDVSVRQRGQISGLTSMCVRYLQHIRKYRACTVTYVMSPDLRGLMPYFITSVDWLARPVLAHL